MRMTVTLQEMGSTALIEVEKIRITSPIASAVRRHNIRGVDPQPDTRLEAGDALVLLGRPAALAAAELRLKGD